MNKDQIIIIGAGPSGLMAAQQLALQGFKVQVFEQNKAAARKFLVAGQGGFNLTHSEGIEIFLQKYESTEIKNIVRTFDNQKVIQWLKDIGISTYVGSSGKVFPTKNFKPIQVLNAWLVYLEQLGVLIHYEHTFKDFDDTSVYLNYKDEEIKLSYSKLVLAMGGGSWRKTGSDAEWVPLLENKGIQITPLQSANSGYNTKVSFQHLEGLFLKNIQVSFDEHQKTGEIVFTKYGIEGSPVYYMNRFTRKYEFPVTLYLDLKPTLSDHEITELLKKSGSISSLLKSRIKLSATAISLLKTLEKDSFTNKDLLTKFIKHFPVEVVSLRPIDEVISTAGGVAFSSLNTQLELKNFPIIYCAGEMIDWEAPTGGYLLQACFSTGYWVAIAIGKA